MAEMSPQLKKAIVNGDIDLEKHGITLQLAEPQNWLDRTRDLLNRKLKMAFIPPYIPDHVEAKADKAIIYREPEGEPKYFDIETPLYLVEGKWQRWSPLVAMVDFWDEKAKRDADLLDVELRDGVMVIK